MDWSDSEDQRAFREEVRQFIAAELPEYYRQMDEPNSANVPWYRHRASEDPELRATAKAWADALASKGWVAPAWPKEYGGAGLGIIEQYIFAEELAAADVPMVGGNGVMMLGPTLILHGTEEQRARVLPGILAGEVAWAQGYSEPGAGSDLASLSTRAVRDGDEYVINGQKIWTTNADVADAVFLLVRTDPSAPKHRGISFLLVEDLRAPGITVRPLEDAAWTIELTETFYDDARVPAENIVGEENRGWYVAMTLLDFERSGVAAARGLRRMLEELFSDLRRGDRRGLLGSASTVRAELADRWIDAEVCSNLSLRIATMQAAGLVPNYEASIGKIVGSELAQAIARTGMKAFGLYSGLWRDPVRAPLSGRFTRNYVLTIPLTIAGGANEIQRNIIANRGLGLPRG